MFTKAFRNDGSTFSAINAAERWLKERDYSVGRMCAPDPMGIMLNQRPGESWDIQKWRNLSAKDKASLHGRVTAPQGFRDGDVTVEIEDAWAPVDTAEEAAK
jgi:hypothetical protein